MVRARGASGRTERAMTFLTFIVGMIAGVILVKVNRHEKEMRSKCLILPSMGIKGKICSTYRITLDEKHDACLFTCMTDVRIPDSVGIFLPSDFHVMVKCETEAEKNFCEAIRESVLESNGQGAHLFVGGTFTVKEGNIIFCNDGMATIRYYVEDREAIALLRLGTFVE